MFLSFFISDETFALLSARFSEEPANSRFAFAVNYTAVAAWIVFSALGFIGSSMIPDTKVLGFDFALPAVFIGILLILIKDRLMWIVAGLAAIASLALLRFGVGALAPLLAAVLSSIVGMILWKRRRS